MKNLSALRHRISASSSERGSTAGHIIRRDQIDAAAFWGKVARGDGCWLWCGERNSSGYGRAYVLGNEKRLAHRCAYAIEHGEVPAGMVVMHTCDNPACVNPAHLQLGTVADNIQDKMAKGRQRLGSRLTAKACWRHGVADSKRCSLCRMEARRSALTRRIDAVMATRAAWIEEVQRALPSNCPRDPDTIATIVGRSRAVLFCVHFGIGDMGPMRQSELARAAGVSRQRVDQIIDACLDRIRKHSPTSEAA